MTGKSAAGKSATGGSAMFVTRLLDLLPRPLDPVRSIKLKLGIVVVCSCTTGFTYFWYAVGWFGPATSTGAVIVALLTSQILAHGMTSPLREMTTAARSMAGGDYSRTVRTTARDEVGELATAFTQMSADLAAADRRRRELVANVSHELRTPISALQAVLENAIDGVGEPAALRIAHAQTERLGRLVAELLDLSRIDAGALALHREPVALGPLLADVVAEAEVATAAADRGVRFTVDVAPPDTVAHADRERLHQVLVNLLDNATRHGPAGGRVQVLARADGAAVVIEVRDEGPGIAPADRERVFERFTRGERAGGGGTGLGLAIARWVVDLHGGRIAVVDPGDPVPDSAAPPGCRIRVTLPG